MTSFFAAWTSMLRMTLPSLFNTRSSGEDTCFETNSGCVQAESMRIRGRIERKAAYLHELQSQVPHVTRKCTSSISAQKRCSFIERSFIAE